MVYYHDCENRGTERKKELRDPESYRILAGRYITEFVRPEGSVDGMPSNEASYTASDQKTPQFAKGPKAPEPFYKKANPDMPALVKGVS
jgi:hypothetical protein